MKLSRHQEVDIVRAWNNNLTSMADLGKQYSMTRQGVWKVLKRHGCDVSKRRLPVSCNACGKEIMRTRKHVRDHKHLFCDQECYTAWLQANSAYEASRYGSRVAREIVKDLYPLQDKHIVHHLNGKESDNRLDNLVVYRNQGDHVRAHRGFDVEPIWQG